jgi:SAM-dependent methyltransferase
MTPTPSARAVSQYATTTGNLTARIALHAYGTNPQDWFSWLDERLPLAGDVLEVGAGTGKLWTHVDHIGRGLRLTLTDFSPAMCEHLHTIPGARVQQCDATDLPFPDDSLDTVIANHMLYHLDDPAAALRDFARVLRPGGRLAIATNGSDHLDELNTIGPAIGRPELRLGAHNNEPFSSWVAVVFGVLEDGDRLDDRGGAVWAAVQLGQQFPGLEGGYRALSEGADLGVLPVDRPLPLGQPRPLRLSFEWRPDSAASALIRLVRERGLVKSLPVDVPGQRSTMHTSTDVSASGP